jgi:hypothetical protein
MRSVRSVFIFSILLALAGCGSQRDQVPGNIRSGSIEDVTNRMEGGGANSERLQEMGIIPVTGHVKPVIPLVKPPEVISFYVFPRKSRDGLSFRDGVWIHRVIKPFSWGVDDAMHEDRLKLSSLMNLRIDAQGQLVVDQAKTLEPDESDVQGMRDMATHMPWRPGDASTPVTRTTVVYPNSGTAISTTQPANQSPNYVQANGSVNLQEVQKAMEEAQQRVREMQQKQSPATGAASAAR